MKISQMTTDQAADALIRIAEPASNIMHDKDTVEVLEKLARGNDNALSFIADNLIPVTTILLKTHRTDVYLVLSALSGKSVDEIGKQKITATIADVKDCWDDELADFFGSLRQ